METLRFEFQATNKLTQRAHVGVVGSGDLEILLEPSDAAHTQIIVRTASKGYEKTWKFVLERFFTVHDVAAQIIINDFGATPGVVTLRLAQALEVSQGHGTAQG